MIPLLFSTGPKQGNARWHCTLPRFILGAALALAIPGDLGAQTVMSLASAEVKSCAGTVNIVGKGGEITPAYDGATMEPGQKLQVGADGTTELVLPGAGAARVEADSEVKLPDVNGKTPPQESLEVLKGRLFLNIDAKELKKQGKREFRLKTPVTVLAVKGTKFFAFASAKGDTLGVHEGMVQAYEPRSKQLRQLEAGTAVEASPRNLSAARPLRPAEDACGFIYPGAPVQGWVVPIGDGDRFLTIGFIQTGNGDRYYLRGGEKPRDYYRELWKESRGGERELVFRCLEGAQPSPLSQLLAGPDDTIFVVTPARPTGDGGLYQIVGGRPRMVSPASAWFRELERTDDAPTTVSFGRKPDGTIDPQGLYFSNIGVKGTYQTTLTSRTTVSPPVLTYPGLFPGGFTMAGANDVYVAYRKDSGMIQHLKNSQDPQDLTTIARLPGHRRGGPSPWACGRSTKSRSPSPEPKRILPQFPHDCLPVPDRPKAGPSPLALDSTAIHRWHGLGLCLALRPSCPDGHEPGFG